MNKCEILFDKSKLREWFDNVIISSIKKELKSSIIIKKEIKETNEFIIKILTNESLAFIEYTIEYDWLWAAILILDKENPKKLKSQFDDNLKSAIDLYLFSILSCIINWEEKVTWNKN